jgi:hypothetical protein
VPADSANLRSINAVAYGPDGSLWLTALGTQIHRVHRIWPDGIVETFGDSNDGGLAGDGGSVRSDSAAFFLLEDITVAPDGSVYVVHGETGGHALDDRGDGHRRGLR